VQVDRSTFGEILHERVTPENALKNFPLRLSYDAAFHLRPVQPIWSINTGEDAGGGANPSGVDLDTIDPLEFEELVRRLLERMGFEASLTKRSHDGGIDVEAINPSPIVGGKVLVQCKRYAGVIGSPAIRDLYGAVTDARANKGVFITTSYFSPDAVKFAEGKQIDLIDRQHLEALLAQHQLL